MSSSDTSSVTKYFSTAAEGFNTTLGTTISASATSVPLNSTSGLTNGAVFVGIIEPAATAQQTFTGTVDVGGSQITNVVWVRGTNVGHAAGVTIVDYVSGASHSMMTAGILKQHTQLGAHTSITTDTLNASGAITITGAAALNGGTTLPAGDIGTADLAAASVTPDKLGTGVQAATVLTSETTTSTSYADLATTTDTVTVTIGANGIAQVSIYAAFTNSGANYTNVGFAISGATTQAATDTLALSQNTTNFLSMGATFLITGLAAGSTTFKMKYDVVAGTGTFKNRRISVLPL